MRTLSMISSAARLVSKIPVVNSVHLIGRRPPGPQTITSASRAVRTAGHSAAGSDNARLPPIVPRLRIAR
jgi:hypothetical protein